jgi:hypothetical protein
MAADPLPITLLDPADTPLSGSELFALVQGGRTLRSRVDALPAPPLNTGAPFVALSCGPIDSLDFPIGVSGDVPGSNIDTEVDVAGHVLLLATFEVDRNYDAMAPFGELMVHLRIGWNMPNGPIPFGAADVGRIHLHPAAAPGNPMAYGPSEAAWQTGFLALACNPGPVHFYLNVAPVLLVADCGFNRVAGMAKLTALLPVKVVTSPSGGLLTEDGADLLTEDGAALITEGS